MMGWSSQDQGQLFYSFNFEAVVPDDHLVRAIVHAMSALTPINTEAVRR